MKKRDWIIVLAIVVGGIIIAGVINCSLTYGKLIKTDLSVDSWLSFWGSYLGGIFTAIVGYLAIIHSNRNSENAILLQEKQLRHQRVIKKLDEYNACLKNNLDLLNIVDIMGVTVGIDYQNLSLVKKDITQRKSQIYARDLQYRYVFEIDVPREKTVLEKQYDEAWIKSRGHLSDLLDEELVYIARIDQNKYDLQLIKNYKQRVYNITEILKQPCNEADREEILLLQKATNREIELLEKQVDSYEKEINAMSLSIKASAGRLSSETKILFDLSILLLKEKERNFTIETSPM